MIIGCLSASVAHDFIIKDVCTWYNKFNFFFKKKIISNKNNKITLFLFKKNGNFTIKSITDVFIIHFVFNKHCYVSLNEKK